MTFPKEVLWEIIHINYKQGVMFIVKIPMSLVVLIWVKCPWQASRNTLLTYQEEIVEIEIEVQVILWVMVDIIPIDLVVYVVVPMAPGGGDGGLPVDPYGGGSDSTSSSEFGRWHRHDWHNQQNEQFEQSMIAINSSLIDLLQYQQRTQNDKALQVIHQSQWAHANDSLIDNIPTRDGIYYIVIEFLKRRKHMCCYQTNSQELALGKAQDADIKCLKSFSADVSWNNVKAILRQQFSLIQSVDCATTCLMLRYQQKGEFNFKFS